MNSEMKTNEPICKILWMDRRTRYPRPLCFKLVNSISESKKSLFHYNVSVLNQKGTNVDIWKPFKFQVNFNKSKLSSPACGISNKINRLPRNRKWSFFVIWKIHLAPFFSDFGKKTGNLYLLTTSRLRHF